MSELPPQEPTLRDPGAERPQGFVRVNVSQPELLFSALHGMKPLDQLTPSTTFIGDKFLTGETTLLNRYFPNPKYEYSKTDDYSFSSDLELSALAYNRPDRGYYSPQRVATLVTNLQEQGVDGTVDNIINGQSRLKILAPGNQYGMEVFLGWPSQSEDVIFHREMETSFNSHSGPITPEKAKEIEEKIQKDSKYHRQIMLGLVNGNRLATGDGIYMHLSTPRSEQEFKTHLEFYRQTYEKVIRALYVEAQVSPRVEITLRPPNRSEDKLTEMRSAQEANPLPRTPEQVVPERLTLNDVKGQDSAVAECRRLVKAINEPEKYELRGIKPPKGALLVGPPGTGKTMIARAIASEADADFIQINAANVGSKWINESAQKVNAIFDDAEKRVREGRKVILFVDEMDAITISRENAHPEDVKTISIFLQRLDGLVESKGVTLLATTNRPDAIDPAILRPGRIDRVIDVPLPDPEGRAAILQIKAESAVKKAKEGYKDLFEPNLDWKAVGNTTDDFSGAELENLINTTLAENLDLDEWKPVTAEQLLLLRAKVKKEYAQKQAMKAQEQRRSEFGFGEGGRIARARAQAQSTL